MRLLSFAGGIGNINLLKVLAICQLL